MKILPWLRWLAREAYTNLAMLPLVALRAWSGRPLLVFARSGAVGDILATRPALCAARRAYPRHLIVFLARPRFRTLVRLLPEVDQVLAPWKSDSVAEAAQRWFDVRFLRYGDELPGHGSTRHFALEMAASVGLPEVRLTDLYLSRSRLRSSASRILLHPGPTEPVRQWPAGHWLELVRRLREAGHADIRQIWFEKHFLYHKIIHAPLPGVDVLVRPAVRDFVAQLHETTLFIGVESGPLHLARALRVPRIGLCGPTDPALRAVAAPDERICHLALPCQFCHHHRPRLHWQTGCPYDIACLTQLPVEPVFAACQELLGSRP